jgi:hypothetical protein
MGGAMKRLFAFVVACGLAASPAAAQPVNDLLVDFGQAHGLWVRLNNSTWRQLDAQSPSSVAACGNGMIYAGFTGRGLLRRSVATSNWQTVRADLVPFRLAAGDTDGNDVCDIGAIILTPPGGPRGKLVMGLNHASGWITLWDDPEPVNFTFGNFDGSPNDDIAGASWTGQTGLLPVRWTRS